MTCLNEVLSITVVECDSLINKVSFPRDSHYFKIRGLGGRHRGREWRESRLLRKGWGGLIAVELCSKHRNREASEVLAPNQVRENWQ